MRVERASEREMERKNIGVGNITVIYTLRFGEFTLPQIDKNAQPLYT